MYCSLTLYMIKFLAHYLKCRYSWVFSGYLQFYLSISIWLIWRFTMVTSKESLGGVFANGKWKGMMGLLADNVSSFQISDIWLIACLSKSADILIQWYSADFHRKRIAEFSPGLPTAKSISILTVPTFTSENGLKIFYIFKQQIWILIVISFITYSMFNFFSIKKQIYFHSIIDYFGLLVGQG